MKKWMLLLVILLVAGLYASSDRYGLRIGSWSWSWSPEQSLLDDLTRRFLVDVQFKNFDHAATFHTKEDGEGKDIASLIEKKFAVKPELLDIRHFEILRIDVSPQADRAKSVNTVTVKVLNSGKTRDVELVLYWKRVEGKWYMDLQSSL